MLTNTLDLTLTQEALPIARHVSCFACGRVYLFTSTWSAEDTWKELELHVLSEHPIEWRARCKKG